MRYVRTLVRTDIARKQTAKSAEQTAQGGGYPSPQRKTGPRVERVVDVRALDPRLLQVAVEPAEPAAGPAAVAEHRAHERLGHRGHLARRHAGPGKDGRQRGAK